MALIEADVRFVLIGGVAAVLQGVPVFTNDVTTRLGNLDLIGSTTGDRAYEDLIGSTRAVNVGQGLEVDVLDLEVIIEMKEALGRDKDRAKLPEYRRTLEERKKRGGDARDPAEPT